jgi:predicted transcriptional regulator of viral defense system
MNHNKTLGPVSAKLISSLYDQNKTIFTVQDVKDITGLKGNWATELTSELIKRNVITRIKRGKYIIIPQELGNEANYIGNWYVVAREIANSPEYYISHYSAMDIHNMLTHPITKVFITTPKQEYKKRRIVGNTTFEFIYSGTKTIWGIQKTWVTKSEQVRVSDIERTIIDCLYRPKYSGGILETVKGLWIQKEKIDFDKLLNYVFKLNKIVVIKRLGYILETLDLKDTNYLDKLREKINNKYYVLDPLLSTEKTYRNLWKLIVNISPEEIRKGVTT